MTITQYLNKTNKNFRKYGILAELYHLMWKIFRKEKYCNKSADYLIKRLDIMTALLDKNK